MEWRLAGRSSEVKGGESPPAERFPRLPQTYPRLAEGFPRQPQTYPRLAETFPADRENPPGRSLSPLHRPLRPLQGRCDLLEKPERDLLCLGGLLEEEEGGECYLVVVPLTRVRRVPAGDGAGNAVDGDVEVLPIDRAE